MSVEAVSLDSGNLTFEWYEASSASDAGTKVGEGSTYTPTGITTDVEGKYYYYAKVINTAAGKGPTSRKSNVAVITVYAPVAAGDEVELLASGTLTGTTGTGYGNPQITITTPVDLAGYAKLEIYYSITGGTPPPSNNDNDWYFAVGTGAGDVYNADGLLTADDGSFAGLYLNLASYSAVTAGEPIVLKYKPAQSGANNSLPYEITSIKLTK